MSKRVKQIFEDTRDFSSVTRDIYHANCVRQSTGRATVFVTRFTLPCGGNRYHRAMATWDDRGESYRNLGHAQTRVEVCEEYDCDADAIRAAIIAFDAYWPEMAYAAEEDHPAYNPEHVRAIPSSW